MPVITVITRIHAPIERCFDLARSIDLHVNSTVRTKEKAIAGKMAGLIELNESVTWSAVHFGIRQKLTSKITEFRRPYFFVDEMQKGAFKKLHHEHHFTSDGDFTIMKDIFEFESPMGILGKLANNILLTQYLKKFIIDRNNIIKDFAESEK